MMGRANKHAYWIFPVLSLLFYFPTYKYGYVTDFLSWLIKYENGSWSDLKDCFDYPGLHHFFHLINFSVFKLVGKSFFGWYLVMSFMQGVNGFLVFIWIRRLNALFKFKLDVGLAWFVAIMFMLSPYAVEPVVWKACLHYLLSMGLIVGGFIYLTEFLESRKSVWKVHVCFVLALFTLEISLAVPFIYLMYWICYVWQFQKWTAIKEFAIRITLPQLAIIVGYFLLNKKILGAWVGHYGADKHLRFDFHEMSGHAFQYLGKYLGFLHYLPFKIKTPIYNAIYHPVSIVVCISLSLLLLYWLTFIKYKALRSSMPMVFSYVAFFMGLFPIANLFFFKSQIYENDRYGYLASLFIYLFIGLVIWSLPRIWKYVSIVIFSGVLIGCSLKTILMAHAAGEVAHGLVDDFRFYDQKNIVVLSKPDNLGGLQIFRDLSGKGQSFTESLWHYKGKQYEGRITDIAQINILAKTDRVGVDVLDSMHLKVKNPQNGSWFWRNGFGLPDFENEEFKVDKEGWYYTLELKNKVADRIFIYSDGTKWKVVDFSMAINQ